MKLAGNRFKPINIFVNFRIINNYLHVAGFPSTKILNDKLVIEYCFGECIFSEGYFTISAMSLSKFYNQQTQLITPPMCRQNNGKHWDCLNALCNYDTTTEKCMSPTIGMIYFFVNRVLTPKNNF